MIDSELYTRTHLPQKCYLFDYLLSWLDEQKIFREHLGLWLNISTYPMPGVSCTKFEIAQSHSYSMVVRQKISCPFVTLSIQIYFIITGRVVRPPIKHQPIFRNPLCGKPHPQIYIHFIICLLELQAHENQFIITLAKRKLW